MSSEANNAPVNGKESPPPLVSHGRVSTREWVGNIGYDGTQLFNKLFSEDIKYLLSMDRLWQKRRPPVPLSWDELKGLKLDFVASKATQGLEEQRVWSVKKCGDVFVECVSKLKQQMEKDGDLVSLLFVYSVTRTRRTPILNKKYERESLLKKSV